MWSRNVNGPGSRARAAMKTAARLGSVLVRRDGLAARERQDRAERHQVDAVLDELDRAVAEQSVDAARVERIRLLVRARLVPGRRDRRRPGHSLVRRHALVVGLAGGAERGARVGPSPVPVPRRWRPPAGPCPRTTGYCPRRYWLTNRSSRPAHSMIATVLLNPSVTSLMAVLPSFSSPLAASVLLR